MAYPPATLPTNRSDATSLQGTHPTDHNAVNLAVNDTVAKLGSDPAGGAATTTAKLAALDQVDSNNGAAIIAIKNPNWVLGVDQTSGNRGFAIAAGSNVINTNNNGDFSINFLPMFAAPPAVLVTPGDGQVNALITIVAVSVSTFSGHAIWANTDTASPIPNAGFRVNWIAIGQK